MAAGARQLSLITREWDVSADCQSPVVTELYARPSRRQTEPRVVIHRGSITPLRVIVHARCRKCPACLRHRSRLWSARMRDETRVAFRTWLGTLTLAPRWQAHAVDVARHRCSRQSIDFDKLSEVERFGLRHNVVSGELTRWLKRVRKNSGAPLRFCLIAEAHKSGAPHYHVLVHERDPAKPVRWAVLSDAWTWGFSTFKLIDDERGATYAAKYLSKSSLARVRASLAYGKDALKADDTLVSRKPRPQRETLPSGLIKGERSVR